MVSQKVAVHPKPHRTLVQAVVASGAEVVPPDRADVLVWFGGDADELRATLDANPKIRWVQLPLAGIESVAHVLDHDRAWTCAKGVYGKVVAEHGLALMLSAARGIHSYAGARSWSSDRSGRTMDGTTAVILGGGGIAHELVAMLGPLGVRTTVVRKRLRPVPGADVTIGPGDLRDALPLAEWVVLALALTPETDGIVDAAFLGRMRADAWLVNLARGRHVRTDDLVAALRAGQVGGAALDVTDPEPLPDGHPLWDLPNALITPHVANTWQLGLPLLARRVTENLARDRNGDPLLGVVDVDLGY